MSSFGFRKSRNAYFALHKQRNDEQLAVAHGGFNAPIPGQARLAHVRTFSTIDPSREWGIMIDGLIKSASTAVSTALASAGHCKVWLPTKLLADALGPTRFWATSYGAFRTVASPGASGIDIAECGEYAVVVEHEMKHKKKWFQVVPKSDLGNGDNDLEAKLKALRESLVSSNVNVAQQAGNLFPEGFPQNLYNLPEVVACRNAWTHKRSGRKRKRQQMTSSGPAGVSQVGSAVGTTEGALQQQTEVSQADKDLCRNFFDEVVPVVDDLGGRTGDGECPGFVLPHVVRGSNTKPMAIMCVRPENQACRYAFSFKHVECDGGSEDGGP